MAELNWTSIGNLPTGGTNWVPHVAQAIDKHLEVFSSDPQGVYWHTSRKASGGIWSSWTKLDIPEGASMQGSYLTAGQEADGRMVVFFRDSDGVVWYTS